MATFLSSLIRPFLPPIYSARNYSWHKFRRDVLAGLTVSVVEIPQSMAYALVAGVPPQYGLYTSILQGIFGALLSSSEHVTTGPTNTQSLLIASTVARMAGGNPELYLHLVFALTFLKGLMQLAFSAAKLGDMVRYVGRSVVVGVTAGAGVLIAASQLPYFLGIMLPTDVHGTHWPGVLGRLQQLWPHWGEMRGRAVFLGIGCIVVMLAIRRINKFLPAAFIAVIGGAVVVGALGWTKAHLQLIDPLQRTFPRFQIPAVNLEQLRQLLGGALALALLGSLESVAIAKSIATKTGEHIDANQEFFTQGLKNFVTSFFQCIPGSVSFTRSALDYAAGAQTRFAAVYNGIFVALFFWIFAGLARFIPLTSLAAVLLVIAWGLIDWRYFLRVWRTSKPDTFVLLATFLATIVAPLEYAIFIGIFLNIGVYLRTASRLHVSEMIPATSGSGPFIERPLINATGEQSVMFIQIEGDLFFAVADELQERLAPLALGHVRVVIIRLKRTHSIDPTVLHVLEQFTESMHARDAYVVLCGIRPEIYRVLKGYGLIDLIGKENVFETEVGIFTSAKEALERAKHLAGTSIDTVGLHRELEEEDATYVI